MATMRPFRPIIDTASRQATRNSVAWVSSVARHCSSVISIGDA
jgi:hypothetical protein